MRRKSESPLGRVYENGDVIVRQHELGDCMYVVQSGEVEVLAETGGGELRLAVLGPGDFFGEMALFERQERSATVRARSDARVLTVDKKTLFRRIQEDPLLAVHILEAMSRRIRDLNGELARLKNPRPSD